MHSRVEGFSPLGLEVLLLFMLVLLLGATLGPSAGAEPKLLATVTGFSSENFWEATETFLEPVGDTGRFRTVSSSNHYSMGNCGDILQNFQKRPLEVMRENGYINQATVDKLMDFEKLGIGATQLTLISLYSDLTIAEVDSYFGPNGVPAERLIKNPSRSQETMGLKLTRVNRGAVYIVRSYGLFQSENGKIEPFGRPLPWELDSELPNGLRQKLDRHRFPFAVEIGRAHAEGKPLPGNFQTAVQIATGLLSNEVAAMKLDPKKMLITAHFLDAQHTRLFTKLFPLRILNDSIQAQLESRGSVPDDYLDQASPRREEWDQHHNSLVYGSLFEFAKSYPIEGTSEVVHKLLASSPVPISGTAARTILDNFDSYFRSHFSFGLEGFGQSSKPIFVRDFGSALFEGRVMRDFIKVGYPTDGEAIIKTRDALETPSMLERDAMGQRFTEQLIMVPMEPLGRDEDVRPMISVANLDRDLAAKAGVLYPVSVILSVAALIEYEIDRLSPAAFQLITQRLNEQRRYLKQPEVSAINLESFLETTRFCLSSEVPSLVALFKEAGGQPLASFALRSNLKGGPSLPGSSEEASIMVVPSTSYCFSYAKIQKLREIYHAFALNARQRLKPTVDDLLIQLLHSPAF